MDFMCDLEPFSEIRSHIANTIAANSLWYTKLLQLAGFNQNAMKYMELKI